LRVLIEHFTAATAALISRAAGGRLMAEAVRIGKLRRSGA